MSRPVFVVDFDGTLIEDHHYPEMGPWLPGAVEALHELLKHGEVLIYTLRVNPYERYHDGDENYRRTMDDVLLQQSMIYDMLNAEGLHGVQLHLTKGKPAGTYYIDNQAIEFRGSWSEILDRVLAGGENIRSEFGGEHTLATPRQDSSKRNPAPPASIHPVSDVSDTTEDSVGTIRQFPTGATRDTAEGKPDFPGFLSPLVIKRYGEYMLSHQRQSDGTLRASGNWKKGIPMDAYLSSAWRHMLDWWLLQEGYEGRESLEDALCAIVFNASGALHVVLTGSTTEQASESPAP